MLKLLIQLGLTAGVSLRLLQCLPTVIPDKTRHLQRKKCHEAYHGGDTFRYSCSCLLSEAKSFLRVQTNQDDRQDQVFAIHPKLIQIYLSFCWMV